MKRCDNCFRMYPAQSLVLCEGCDAEVCQNCYDDHNAEGAYADSERLQT